MDQIAWRYRVRPHVRLDAAKGVGVVLLMRTGIVFVNQAGGYACMQCEMEGIYIPLDDDFNDIEAKLHEYFTGPKHGGSGATSGLDEADADRIDEILRSRHSPCPVTVDRSLLNGCIGLSPRPPRTTARTGGLST